MRFGTGRIDWRYVTIATPGVPSASSMHYAALSMRTVVFVAGARPNFVKIAPLLCESGARGTPFRAELVHTGQHYDFEMSGVFFDQLGIRSPDAFLQVGSATHGVQTGRIMHSFDEWLAARREPPAAVVVVGDVNSTMACALVAAKRGIPVAHVEAGLRSFDRTMPEEINRVVTDAVSDLLLVSEPAGLANLAKEGIASARIEYVGNVMIDTLVRQLPEARALSVASRWQLATQGYAVVTLHRPSNVDVEPRLASLATFLRSVAAQIPLVFAVHPRTVQRLRDLELADVLSRTPGLHMCPPLSYREFLSLVASSRLVLTDSGGIQEETTYLDVPCITLRTTTERPVTVSDGSNVLVGEDLNAAACAVADVIAGRAKHARPIEGWDGRASSRILDALSRHIFSGGAT